MAKKRLAVEDGGLDPVPAAPTVLEVVDECKAALAAECEAYVERNKVQPTEEFKRAEMAYWLANNTKKLTDALERDVLG